MHQCIINFNNYNCRVIIIEMIYYIYISLGKDLSLKLTIFLPDIHIILFMFLE